eukprot:s15_g19.t2
MKFTWQEIQKHQPDILGLCEVDRFEDFEVDLADDGYEGTYKRKRSPAKDGVATFWKTARLEEGLRRAIFLEYGNQRTKAAQVAILQRLWPRDRSSGKGLVVCAVHLRASADEAFRMQQASELVTALTDFARGDEQIILADVSHAIFAMNPWNSNFDQSSSGLAASNVYSYFTSCGYRCAYQTMRTQAAAAQYSHYTTWAGWASGDFMACCDHIFISQGVDVEAVLNVPDPDALAEEFPEKLPCAAYPSDHLSLVADVLVLVWLVHALSWTCFAEARNRRQGTQPAVRLVKGAAKDVRPPQMLHPGFEGEMVLVAIEQDPDCLELIEDTWRADREVMLACVSRAPERLALAAATLQEQTDVVLKAIFTDSEALQFASEAMRGCKRVVLKAQEIRRPFVSLLKLCEMTLRRLLDPRCTSGGPSNGGSAAYFKPCGMQERHCSTHLTSVTGQWT